jgi:hypothetical protein
LKKAVSYSLNFGDEPEPPAPIPEQHAELLYQPTLAARLVEDWYAKEGQLSDDEVGVVLTYDDGSSDVFHVDIDHEVSFHAHKSSGK